MAAKTTTLTLPDLVDLALCGPEMGAVNFNILHIILHIIIQQMDRISVQIEFQGEESDRLNKFMATKNPGTRKHFTEYVVKPGEGKVKKLRSKEKMSLQDVTNGGKTNGGAAQRIVVIDTEDSPDKIPTVVVSKQRFETVEQDVIDMKKKILDIESLPSNQQLIEALKGGDPEAITDVLKIINLNKRVEAAESGVDKMASLIGDLAKGTIHRAQSNGEQSKDLADKVDEFRASLTNAGSRVPSVVSTRYEDLNVRVQTLEKAIKEGQFVPIESLPADTAQNEVTADPGGAENSEEPNAPNESKRNLNKATISKMPPAKAIVAIQDELEQLQEKMAKQDTTELIKEIEALKERLTSDSSDLPPEIRLAELEKKFAETMDQIDALDLTYNTRITSIQEQTEETMKKFASGMGGDPTGVNDETMNNITNTLHKMEEVEQKIESVTESINELQKDKFIRQVNMDAMLEQIEMLKTGKANREDLEDALDEKADTCAIDKKVSYSKFDAVCDDFNKGLEEALNRLTDQQQMWHEALENIQKEIGGKLDKEDVNPIQDYVNSKLKSLQDKFKALIELKKEREAAGSKSKYLRDVNCISCDKEVVMKRQMDPTLKPMPQALPSTKSIAPYLAYELDELRKQQKDPTSRNMNFFEKAMKANKPKEQQQSHLVNRYCGGSHTITTPKQRVTRMGNFMEQWGPEIIPVEDEYIKGKDNHMYKARTDPPVLNKASKDGQNQSKSQIAKEAQEGANAADKEQAPKTSAIQINTEATEALSQQAKNRSLTDAKAQSKSK